MDVHTKIKFMRLSKNYTQSYMADELGIDVTNYSRMERGNAQISIDRLIKIAAILDADVADFIEKNPHSSQDDLSHVLQEILREIRIIRKKLDE